MKRWVMAAFVVFLALSSLSWPRNAIGAAEKIVPTQLAEKSALYNAKRRWGNEARIYERKTYVDLTGQPAAYVYTIYKKAGDAPTGSALSNRITEARGRLRESQARLDQLNHEARDKGKRFTAPTPSPEAETSEAPAGSALLPVSAVLPADFLATDQQPSVRINSSDKKANVRQAVKQKVHQLRREVFQMDLFGTVVVGAHFGAMPFLEMFDGLALHHTMLDQADAVAADTLGTENVQRGDFVYLGPTFFVYEHVQNGRRVLTDPTTGRSADKETVRSDAARSGLSSAAVNLKSDPAEAWRFIADEVDADGRVTDRAGSSAVATGAVRGVPFYHQDDYGVSSCGPTASAQLLGYWDDHGFGNLIDNGRSNTGHEWQLIYDLMEAERYDPNVGTYGDKIRPGMLSVANDGKYGNGNNFSGAEIAAYAGGTLQWSHITGEIDAGRPFVYFNWDGSSYPYWAHFTTAVGYSQTGSTYDLHVHYNYPPDRDYIINRAAVSANNEAMYMIYPGTPYMTIFSEDVEGLFPGPWRVFSTGNTDAYWDDTAHRPHAGYNPGPYPPAGSGNTGWSAYCAYGGSAGVDPPGPYPNNTRSWMVYGPFSLKRIANAKLEFYYWNVSQGGWDALYWMASSDGLMFYGPGAWGNSGGWQKGTLDLSSYAGDDSVWVAFWFSSDSSTVYEGGYVDDITIRKSDGWTETTKLYLGDYNADLRSDLGLFRPSGWWYVRKTTGEVLLDGASFGQPGDVPVMGDYDGDGEMDIAVFRPSTGVWYARNRAGAILPGFPYMYGQPEDVPVPGDYDGDGRTDIAIFRPSLGVWYARSYATGSWQNLPGFPYCFGRSGDIPVPAAYSFTGKTDIALWRPSTGNWYARVYSCGAWSNVAGFPLTYGVAGDRPVPGDYNGDAIADIGIFRPSTGKWYARMKWGETIFSGVQWGASGDVPVPLDYDGDGATELAVWRPSTGSWRVAKPDLTTLVSDYRFGLSTDKPLGYNSGVAFLFF